MGLDQPPVMNEAKAFFAGRGVPSFSLAPGPLVLYPLLVFGSCLLWWLAFKFHCIGCVLCTLPGSLACYQSSLGICALYRVCGSGLPHVDMSAG